MVFNKSEDSEGEQESASLALNLRSCRGDPPGQEDNWKESVEAKEGSSFNRSWVNESGIFD